MYVIPAPSLLPAKPGAGIQRGFCAFCAKWIPACAGMTAFGNWPAQIGRTLALGAALVTAAAAPTVAHAQWQYPSKVDIQFNRFSSPPTPTC